MRRMHVLRYLTEFRKVRAVKITSKVVWVWISMGRERERVLVVLLFVWFWVFFPKSTSWYLPFAAKMCNLKEKQLLKTVGEMTSNIWASLFNPWMESKSSFFSCSSSVMPLDPWMKCLSLLRKLIFSVYWHWLGSSVGDEFLSLPCCWLTVVFKQVI